jgi:hypothetical protein
LVLCCCQRALQQCCGIQSHARSTHACHTHPPQQPRRRKEHLAARAATKADNKKAKREKKLLRAGFEGRKAGFINPSSGGGRGSGGGAGGGGKPGKK